MRKFLVTMAFVVEMPENIPQLSRYNPESHLEYLLSESTTIEIDDSQVRDENNNSPDIFINRPVFGVEELRDSYHYPWS